MTSTAHSLADEYLRRLQAAARDLPRSEREELIAQIREHLAAGLPQGSTEVEMRNVLDELGAPEDIVAAAQPERAATRRGAREVFALILLVTGFPPILGWLAGAGLLLWSPLWTGRQKLLGLLIWPGGYVIAVGVVGLTAIVGQSCDAGPVQASAQNTCTSAGPSAWSIAALMVLVLAPMVVATYLYRAAARRELFGSGGSLS